jgi:hypothetical protein
MKSFKVRFSMSVLYCLVQFCLPQSARQPAWLLDNWKLFLTGARTQEDFDLVLCTERNMLVTASTKREMSHKDAGASSSAGFADMLQCTFSSMFHHTKSYFVADRDDAASGSGAPTFTKKARREKYGQNELSSVPLWVRFHFIFSKTKANNLQAKFKSIESNFTNRASTFPVKISSLCKFLPHSNLVQVSSKICKTNVRCDVNHNSRPDQVLLKIAP